MQRKIRAVDAISLLIQMKSMIRKCIGLMLAYCLTMVPVTAQEAGMLKTLPDFKYEGSARKLLLDLCREANVRIFFDDDVPDAQVTASGKNITVADLCTEVLTQAGYSAATDGDTIFVLTRKFDHLTPESAVLQMHTVAGKEMDAGTLDRLREAQDAYTSRQYDLAKTLMRNALEASYGVKGKEGYIYEIVRRYADIYAKEGVPPQRAIDDFNQDDFLSRLLIRFMKRDAVADANFDRFKECIAELDKPTLGTGPLTGFATSDSDRPQADGSPSANYNATRVPQALPRVGLNQQLSVLEDSILGKRYEKHTVPQRLSRMEKLMFPQDFQRKNLSIPERVRDLFAAADPSGSLLSSAATSMATNGTAQPNNWFLNPPPMKMFDGFSKGVGKIGAGIVRGPAEAGKNILTSPLFWETASLVGAYFLVRKMAGSQASTGSRGHACVGGACNVCKNCSTCPHCKFNWAKCSVYYNVHRLPTP